MRTAALSALAVLALAGAASAHPATEQYVPIGQSPGPGVVQGTAEPVVEPAAGPPIVGVEREGDQIGA